MPQTQHPRDFEPKLTPEYLGVVCHNVLEAAYRALAAASTEDDTNWTVGTLLYGRVHGRFKTMHRDKSLPWFQLANSTMDYTPSVNGVLMQVVWTILMCARKLTAWWLAESSCIRRVC